MGVFGDDIKIGIFCKGGGETKNRNKSSILVVFVQFKTCIKGYAISELCRTE